MCEVIKDLSKIDTLNLNFSTRLLLRKLITEKNANHKLYFSKTELAEQCNMSIPTIKRRLKDLKGLEFIDSEERKGYNGDQLTNCITVRVYIVQDAIKQRELELEKENAKDAA